MSKNILNIKSYHLFIMSYYISKFVNYATSPRKLFISIVMFFYRWFTGYFTDKVFNFMNGFRRKSPLLPPVQNPLLFDSALTLAAKIRTRQVSCVNVIEAYIGRIQQINPLINAVVDDRNAEALEEASLVDELVSSGTKTVQDLAEEMPLLGVPFSVKEAISVKGLSFTTGVVRRRGIKAKEDADVISLLRKAGAIPIVVTNTSEQCFWVETYNNLYGRTNNPYDLNRTAGGSSGGEAALLASAGSVVGVGNDIGGSIRIPAFYNGIFGHKPSRGVVPNRGHFPKSDEILHQYIGTGPMCRYACDLNIMLKAMAGPNASLLQLDKKVSLKSLKVYYMEDDGESNFTLPVKDSVKNAVKKVVSHFQKICDMSPQKVHIRGLKHGFIVWAHAVSAGVLDITTVESHVFGKDHNSNIWKEFILSMLGLSQYSFPVVTIVLVEKYFGPKEKSVAEPFIRIQKRLETEFQKLLQEDCVFIMPTMPQPATHHYANLLRAQNCGYVTLFNILGLPSTNCPVGLDDNGMPVGVQVISGLKNDYLNFAVAKELEREFDGWLCPRPIV